MENNVELEVLDIGSADIKALDLDLVAGISLFKDGMIRVVRFKHLPDSVKNIVEVPIPAYKKDGVWLENIQIKPEEELISGELFGLLCPSTLKLLHKIAEKISNAGIKDASFPVHPYISLRLEKKINPFFGHIGYLAKGNTGLFPDGNIRGFRMLEGEDNAVFISNNQEVREIFLGDIHRQRWLPSSRSLWKSPKKIGVISRQMGNHLFLTLKNGDSLRINILLLRERRKGKKIGLFSLLRKKKPIVERIGGIPRASYVGPCHFSKDIAAAVSQNGEKIYLFPAFY